MQLESQLPPALWGSGLFRGLYVILLFIKIFKTTHGHSLSTLSLMYVTDTALKMWMSQTKERDT